MCVNSERSELCDRSSYSLARSLITLCDRAMSHVPTLPLALGFAHTGRRGGGGGPEDVQEKEESNCS